MASQIVRYTIPVGATFIFHGTVLADSMNRPNPAAVYAEPKDCGKASNCPRIENRDPANTELERLVMEGRKHLGPYKDIVMRYADCGFKQASVYYEKLLDNLCYLRTRAPQEVRIGTVVVSGISGMLLGIRGGFFRKIFMTSLGTGGGAYLAYPYESEKYAKKYSAIAYNFVSGTRK
jgi:hypothetical protein